MTAAAFDSQRRPVGHDGLVHRHAHIPPVRRGYLVLLLCMIVPPLSTDRPDDYDRPWSGAGGLRFVGRVARYIRDHSLTPPSDRQLYESAIAAMLARVGDRYTQFLPALLGRETQNTLDGEVQGGIGALLAPQPPPGGGLDVKGFFPDSAARDAGLEAGDRLVAVDGVRLDTLNPMEMLGRLRGPAGSPVVLEYRRGGEEHKVFLRRRRLPDGVLTACRMLADSPVGYIRLGVFSRRAPGLLAEAVRKLQGEGMRALVLDLRGNGGGELLSGEAAADLFLDRGLIAITERREPGQDAPGRRQERHALPDSLGSFPMAILINHETASAAELFSAALRGNNRALLFGTRSFGKSAIQDILPIDGGGAALRLTTGRFLTPDGYDIADKGLRPDRPIPISEEMAALTGRVLENERYGMAWPADFRDPVLEAARAWLESAFKPRAAGTQNGSSAP